MKKFLCVGEKYGSGDAEKIAWKRIGEIFESKAGKEYCKLYMHPGLLISVFEDKPKDATATVKQGEYGPLAPDEEIPF